MKKLLLLSSVSLLTIFYFTSCIKDDAPPPCTSNTLTQDKHIIDSFNNDEGYTMTYNTDTGVYYTIVDPGTGSAPTIDSVVLFNYKGYLLDGTLIDSATTPSGYRLRDYTNIQSFARFASLFAIPRLKEGGLMRIIIPSSNNAGCRAYVTPIGKTVPANSQLLYDITLIDVSKQ